MVAVRLSDVALRAGVSLATASRVLNGSPRSPARTSPGGFGWRPTSWATWRTPRRQALAGRPPGSSGWWCTTSRPVLLHHRPGRPGGREGAAQPGAAGEHRPGRAVRAGRGQRLRVLPDRRDHLGGLPRPALRRRADPAAAALHGQRRPGRHLRPDRVRGSQGCGGAEPRRRGPVGQALVGRGLRRFAIFGGPPDLVTTRERVAGFSDALAAAGLAPWRSCPATSPARGATPRP